MAGLIYKLVKSSLKVQFVTPRTQAVQNLETSSIVRQIEVSLSKQNRKLTASFLSGDGKAPFQKLKFITQQWSHEGETRIIN